MRDARTILADQFDDLEQQEHAATTGMWVFIATEVLFFGGLFLAYFVFRASYPREFAIGGERSNLFLGTINTGVLLSSSFTMALAVQFGHAGLLKRVPSLLIVTILFGVAFLAIKGLEYHQHFSDHLFPGRLFQTDLPKQTQLFFWLYFVMTGLHALHVFIGICILSVIAFLAHNGYFSERYSNPLKISGLYWHFVDVVWVFLYPLFYLIHK